MYAFFGLGGTSWRRFLLPALFALMLVSASIVSMPAKAQCTVLCVDATAATVTETGSMLAQWGIEFEKWAQNIAMLAQIIEIITFITNTFSKFMNLFTEKLDTLIATLHIDEFLNAKLAFLFHIDLKTTISETNLALAEALGQSQYPWVVDRKKDQHHCYRQIISNGLASVNSHVGSMTSRLMSMHLNKGRGERVNALDPANAAASMKISCGVLFGVKLLSDIDAAPDKCVDRDMPFMQGRDLMLPPIEEVMEEPPGVLLVDLCNNGTLQCTSNEKKFHEDAKTKIYIPDSSAEQKKHFAAIKFCDNVLGNVPTPPAGKGMTQHDGVVITDNWKHCKALQMAFIHQCDRRIAYSTRVKCSESMGATDDNYAECQHQKKVCYAALYAGVKVPGITDPPETCYKGLTPYQTEYLARLTCLNSEHAVAASRGGGTPVELMMMNDMCNLSMATWKAQLAADETALVSSLMALLELKDCWPDTSVSKAVKTITTTP